MCCTPDLLVPFPLLLRNLLRFVKSALDFIGIAAVKEQDYTPMPCLPAFANFSFHLFLILVQLFLLPKII